MPEIKISSPVALVTPPRFLPKLKKLGIDTIADLLYHFPVRYENWSDIIPIRDLRVGESAPIRGTIKKIGFRKSWGRYRVIIEATIADQSGEIRAFWFNQPYVRKNLPEGKEAVFYGKILSGKKGIFISNPAYETIKDGQGIISFSPRKELLAIYPETKGLTSKGIRFLVEKAIKAAGDIPEFIPEGILTANRLPEINRSLKNIHSPENIAEADTARKRFEFEELFLLQLNNFSRKAELASLKSAAIPYKLDFIKQILSSLPFDLTLSQKRSLHEILIDLAEGRPMNRLLQGDVGSGKTIIAAIAALAAARAGCQTAIMAPTEILANQHYETFKKFFGKSGYSFCLITAKSSFAYYNDGLESEIKKDALLKEIGGGKIEIVIGTHALIAKRKNSVGLPFKKLGLIIVDEQHRFGVRQRAELMRQSALAPHFLSMSATPIPRTLAITVFGDLDLSLIDELPPGRKPIITKIVSPENRANAYAFIRGQARKGRQVFVICPRIEPTPINADNTRINAENSAAWEVKTVKEEFGKLSREIFPDLRVAMLHGKMKPEEKRKIMADFKIGKTDILVSTSVIEVGIDVPNANIMIIEGAERFGLAQLYQFRGRVGRGGHQSFCLLFTDSSSEETLKRLDALLEAKNGFELAEKDLSLRGPGEFLGTEQTGFPDIIMSALKNRDLVKKSREAAEEILKIDPRLRLYPKLKEKLSAFSKETHLE